MARRPKIDCDEIVDGLLYLGSAQAAKSLDGLTGLGITHIVNLAGRNYFPDQFVYLKRHFKDSDVHFLHIARQVFEFVDGAEREGQRVFVHCLGGMSRSAAVVTAYLMQRYHLDYEDALARVKTRRAKVNPNKYFVQQLIEFESEVLNKQAIDEIDDGDS